MKVKTSELTGAALDWAVARCELMTGQDYTLAVDTDIDGTKRVNFGGMYPEWSSDWQEAGPIIEREKIECLYDGVSLWYVDAPHGWYEGPTPLIAAMRCYVASQLGDEIEIPEQLMEGV